MITGEAVVQTSSTYATMRDMPDNAPAMFTTAEVAQHLRVDPSTVRRWIATGVLPATKIGRDYRVSVTGLRRVMGEARTSSPLVTR